MLLDLLPSEQAAPQRPARVVGGALLLDLLMPAPVPAPTPQTSGGGSPPPLYWGPAPRVVNERRRRDELALFLLGAL